MSERRSKYNAVRRAVDGIMFASVAEARRYGELELLLQAGKITELKLQPEFELLPAFEYNGEKIRAIKYRADFSYKDDEGLTAIEDVKGMRTEVYKLKRKMFLNIIKQYDWMYFVEVE